MDWQTLAGWLTFSAIAGAFAVYAVLQVKCLRGWRGRYRLLAALPLLWWAAWGAILVLDPARDSTVQAFWPIAAMVGIGPCLVLLLILMMLHVIETGRWFETPHD